MNSRSSERLPRHFRSLRPGRRIHVVRAHVAFGGVVDILAPRRDRAGRFAAVHRHVGKRLVETFVRAGVVVAALQVLHSEMPCPHPPFMAHVMGRVGSRARVASFIALKMRAPSSLPCSPSSLHIDHMIMDGWFRSRSTISFRSDRSLQARPSGVWACTYRPGAGFRPSPASRDGRRHRAVPRPEGCATCGRHCCPSPSAS